MSDETPSTETMHELRSVNMWRVGIGAARANSVRHGVRGAHVLDRPGQKQARWPSYLGPASLTSADTWSLNFAKLSLNIFASLAAAAS